MLIPFSYIKILISIEGSFYLALFLAPGALLCDSSLHLYSGTLYSPYLFHSLFIFFLTFKGVCLKFINTGPRPWYTFSAKPEIVPSMSNETPD